MSFCLPLYLCFFLSFPPVFPPLTNNIPFFYPFSLPRQNGSRRSGRSLNTPACGSRRVCPSAASTLADDSSSRSFERRPASLFLPLSFSFFLSFLLSCFLFSFSLSFSFSSYLCILLSSDSSRLFQTTDVRPAIERRSIYFLSGYGTHRSDRHTVPSRHRSCCSRSFSNVATGWHFGRPGNHDHAPVDTGG